MKYALSLLFICALFICSGSFAATDITSSAVSGHWTTAGSPYNIHNGIYIPGGNALTIDSGVEVVFMGDFGLTVTGVLNAQGTATAPILFHVQDTTGWSNLSVAGGGWSGINFPYLAIADTTKLKYCKIYDVKNGNISIGRPITIAKTEIYHCISSSDLVYMNNYYGLILITGCDVHNNFVTINSGGEDANIFFASNLSGWGVTMPGEMQIDNTLVHDNSSTATLYGRYANMILKNNTFNNNNTDDEGVFELAYYDSVYLDNNKIYQNVTNGMAAVHCICSWVDITGNYICNNNDMLAGCTATQGGGGIHLSGNGYPATLHYTVRNNIIANNACVQSGGGIYMFHAGAVITNNVFANNATVTEGSAIGIDNTWNTTVIKNNIFYHNRSWSDTTLKCIWSAEGGYYYFTNNYMDYDIPGMVDSWVPFNLVGDSTHNIIGNNPMFVSPTTVLGDSADALTADFNVSGFSPCINAGDSAFADAYTTDYLGNARIIAVIDIGPYECENCSTYILGAPALKPADKFEVYPNPSEGNISIVLPAPGGTVTITDLSGRNVLSLPANNKTLSVDLNGYPKGVYVINWQEEGHAKGNKKIVIQ